jgi:hypothetical protein
MTQQDRMLDLAKRGARAQLGDLIHEIKMLLEIFPHLRDSVDVDELPIGFLLKKGARRARKKVVAEAAAGPVKRKLSAAARRAISNAQKKRWAAFHAAKKAK